jgi:hypothetical protein
MQKIQKIQNQYIAKQFDEMKKSNNKLKHDVETLTNMIDKFYTPDTEGRYVVNGWFVEFHDLIDTPDGVILGATLNKIHGVPLICFKTNQSYPFLGPAEKPMFFPKPDNIGLRAMTIFKIPFTGYYDFNVTTDDGMRFYYQKVESNVMMNEKNVRSPWNTIIDSWVTQATTYITSKKIYFNQNDLIFMRIDYYHLSGGYASQCIKLRRYVDQINDTETNNMKIKEMDFPHKNLFCSLLWSEVPLLGFS